MARAAWRGLPGEILDDVVLAGFIRALDGFEAVLAGVAPGRWDAPSPCESWSAADVAGHVIGDLRAVEAYATGRNEADSVVDPRTAAGDNPLAAWRAARADMMAALSPAALARPVPLPWGGQMPLADIEWVLARAHEYCDGRGLGFDSYPMHELAAHPDAAELFGLFNAHSGTAAGGTMFEPWPTTGVPLALREDWRDVLRAAAGTGTAHLWLAFHGVGEVHDRQVSRPGAYAESCLAAERAREAGLSVGANVFLTRDSLSQLDELIGVVGRLADAGACFETPGFLPTPRSRHHERLRLTLPDLAPWAARLGELANPVGRSQWADLETRTEAAWVRRALADDWPEAPAPVPGELALVCRPNLDVYSGLAGRYRTRHGNLRADGVAAVLGRALERGRERDDALWFGPGPLPAPDELAARHGDATGLGVHMGPESARYLWLDRAGRAGAG